MQGMIHHRVLINDTLGKLAREFYGDFDLWRYIYMHNSNVIDNPEQLTPGLMIVIPYHPNMRVNVVPYQAHDTDPYLTSI